MRLPCGQSSPRPCITFPPHTIPVVPAWLSHSHSTALQSAIPWLTSSLRCHDTDAALGPPQAPRHGQSGTLSLHCVGSSPLPVGREFVVYFVHSTEHVAHGAVSNTSRGWPPSCANAGRADIRALIGPLAPSGHADSGVDLRPRSHAPAHTPFPPLQWPPLLRSCAPHSMPSRFTAHMGAERKPCASLGPS